MKLYLIIVSLVAIFVVGGIGILLILPNSVISESLLNTKPIYYQGISVTLYSENKLQELEDHYKKELTVTVIDDEDLKDVPELKILIKKAISMEYPLNTLGKTLTTFKDLDNFQKQYAEILSEKYSKKPTDFFSTKKDHAGHYVRTFEAHYFEYDGQQYWIQPHSTFLSVDDAERYIGISKSVGPLREKDHTWADITEKQIDAKSLIMDAMDDIGQHQENIHVSVSLSSTTLGEYREWYANTVEISLFDYDGHIFVMGTWIA